ncbi:hypothetical protein OAX95_01115, partial [bacterium]|nr:hypothetical protein [bacterium]
MKPATIDTDELRSAVESGRTLTSIAAELGVSPATVSRAAKRAGIAVPRRPPPITRRRPHPQLDDPDWIAAAYAGRTITDIANELDVSVSTVSAALQRHRIPLRNSSAARTLKQPAQLRDPDWLRVRYEHATATEIADELGINPQMVYAAMSDHGIERRTPPATQRSHSHPQLDDTG